MHAAKDSDGRIPSLILTQKVVRAGDPALKKPSLLEGYISCNGKTPDFLPNLPLYEDNAAKGNKLKCLIVKIWSRRTLRGSKSKGPGAKTYQCLVFNQVNAFIPGVRPRLKQTLNQLSSLLLLAQPTASCPAYQLCSFRLQHPILGDVWVTVSLGGTPTLNLPPARPAISALPSQKIPSTSQNHSNPEGRLVVAWCLLGKAPPTPPYYPI